MYPTQYDAVLGGQNPALNSAAVLGGIEGLAQKLNSSASSKKEKIEQLFNFLKYHNSKQTKILFEFILSSRDVDTNKIAYSILRCIDMSQKNDIEIRRQLKYLPVQYKNTANLSTECLTMLLDIIFSKCFSGEIPPALPAYRDANLISKIKKGYPYGNRYPDWHEAHHIGYLASMVGFYVKVEKPRHYEDEEITTMVNRLLLSYLLTDIHNAVPAFKAIKINLPNYFDVSNFRELLKIIENNSKHIQTACYASYSSDQASLAWKYGREGIWKM